MMAGTLLLVRYSIFVPLFKQNHVAGLMPGWQFMLLVITTLLIGAGGYVINDVLDIELDRINKPGKQIVGKYMSEATGNRLHFNLTAAGISTGLVFSYLCHNLFLGVLFVIIPTALFYYSYKYKYLPVIGNLVVSLLAAIVVIIYWLFEFYYLKDQPEIFIETSLVFSQINRFVFAFALFAFITTFTREIIKDTQDIDGDSRFGCRTLPVVLGLSSTRFLLMGLEAITVALLAWFQLTLFRSGYSWMAYGLIITQLLLCIAIVKSYLAKDKRSFGQLSTVLKLVMISGMATLITTWFRNI
jgi:4-hydroxybenzoate polyprenyltransferase